MYVLTHSTRQVYSWSVLTLSTCVYMLTLGTHHAYSWSVLTLCTCLGCALANN